MRRAHGPNARRSRTGRAFAAVGAALLLIAGVQALAPAASAWDEENATRQLVDGNPRCSGKSTPGSQSLGFDHGFKIDPPSDGTHDDDDFTVDVDFNEAQTSFDFSDASPAVLAVIVKASNQAYVYYYDSPVTGDTALESVPSGNEGGYHQISHVDFCWDDGGEDPSSTVAKLWFDSDEELVEDPESSDIVVTVTPDEGEAFTLDHDDLTDADGIAELEYDAEDVAVDETTVPDGWDEFSCPEQHEDEADFVFCNKREAEIGDTDVTVKKVWLDSSGDQRSAPSDSDIAVTVDVADSSAVVLDHEDLTDGDGVASLSLDPDAVNSVSETTVPAGWDAVPCPEAYLDDADYVLCNEEETRRRRRGGGGGGTTTTTTTIVTEVLPFTPEPEVLPEVLPETITTTAPQLPFTGSSSLRLAAVATALLALGAAMIATGRRRPGALD